MSRVSGDTNPGGGYKNEKENDE